MAIYTFECGARTFTPQTLVSGRVGSQHGPPGNPILVFPSISYSPFVDSQSRYFHRREHVRWSLKEFILDFGEGFVEVGTWSFYSSQMLSLFYTTLFFYKSLLTSFPSYERFSPLSHTVLLLRVVLVNFANRYQAVIVFITVITGTIYKIQIFLYIRMFYVTTNLCLHAIARF